MFWIISSFFCILGGVVILLFYCPTVFAEVCNILCPDQIVPIDLYRNGQHYQIQGYYKKHAHRQIDGQLSPAILLCNLPISTSSEHTPHLKLFRDWIGVFQSPDDWFRLTSHYVFIVEGALLSIPLEDDMKGWNCTYTVQKKLNQIRYEIFPAPPIQPDHLVISVPLQYMENIPQTSKNGEMIRYYPYRSNGKSGMCPR